MFSGFGVFRATNKGGCNHDFFRCCKVEKRYFPSLEFNIWSNYTICPPGCSRAGLGWLGDKELLQAEVRFFLAKEDFKEIFCQVRSVHRFCEQQTVEGRSGKVSNYKKKSKFQPTFVAQVRAVMTREESFSIGS